MNIMSCPVIKPVGKRFAPGSLGAQQWLDQDLTFYLFFSSFTRIPDRENHTCFFSPAQLRIDQPSLISKGVLAWDPSPRKR